MARAQRYGATLYQRPRRAPGARLGGVAAVLLVLVAFVAGGAGAVGAAERSSDFRVPRVQHVRGVSHLTVLAPPALGEDPPPADQIEVLDAAEGFPLDAQVSRLPHAPLEVVVVADVSGGLASIEAIQGALREFILSLPEGSAVTIVSAGDRPHLVASLTRSPDAALAGLALLAPTRPGLPEAAIGLGLDQLTGTPGTRPVVVEVRTGSYSSATGTGTPLDATRDRLEEGGIDVYAVHLGTDLPGGTSLPVPIEGGFVLTAPSIPNLLGALDTIAVDLSLPRYRVDVFGLDKPTGVRLVADWHGVHSERDTIAGPDLPSRAPDEVAADPPLAKLAAAAAGIVLVAAVLVVPSARRRRRARRDAALPPRPAGLRVDPSPPAPPLAEPARSTGGLGGEDVEGVEAVRALLTEGTRPVSEVWVADDVETAVRAELAELAAGRRVPVRAGARPGAALPVAAKAGALVPADLRSLWAGDPGAVVLAVAGTPSPAGLGSVLRAAAGGDTGEKALAGVVLPRQPASRVTAATAAAAAGALERVPLALVPDLGAALAVTRAAGVRVLGVVRGGAAGGPPADLELDGPTLVVVSASGELERGLRARCDAVVPVAGDGLVGRVERLVTMLTGPETEVELRDAVAARTGSR